LEEFGRRRSWIEIRRSFGLQYQRIKEHCSQVGKTRILKMKSKGNGLGGTRKPGHFGNEWQSTCNKLATNIGEYKKFFLTVNNRNSISISK